MTKGRQQLEILQPVFDYLGVTMEDIRNLIGSREVMAKQIEESAKRFKDAGDDEETSNIKAFKKAKESGLFTTESVTAEELAQHMECKIS